jgi:hypothetical protein
LDVNVALKYSAATILLVLYICITALNAGGMWPSSAWQNFLIVYGTVFACERELNFEKIIYFYNSLKFY